MWTRRCASLPRDTTDECSSCTCVCACVCVYVCALCCVVLLMSVMSRGEYYSIANHPLPSSVAELGARVRLASTGNSISRRSLRSMPMPLSLEHIHPSSPWLASQLHSMHGACVEPIKTKAGKQLRVAGKQLRVAGKQLRVAGMQLRVVRARASIATTPHRLDTSVHGKVRTWRQETGRCASHLPQSWHSRRLLIGSSVLSIVAQLASPRNSGTRRLRSAWR